MGSDLELNHRGEWGPWDAFGDVPAGVTAAGVDSEDELADAGWGLFTRIGSGELTELGLVVWQRDTTNTPEYLVLVEGLDRSSAYLRIPDLPQLMTLLGQWAPIVQAASISWLTRDLARGNVVGHGVVEAVVKRASRAAGSS